MTDGRHIPQKPVLDVLCAIQGALGEENQQIFSIAGISLGRNWAKTIPRANDVQDLLARIAAYLRDGLQLAKTVEFENVGQDYIIKVRGCHLCHGHLVKERHGIVPACVIAMFPLGALIENLEVRSARLKEVRKPGPPGDCDLVYSISVRQSGASVR
jgi:hypothetical protein